MAMPFAPFLQSITPRGLLSFGPDTEPLELRPLNVLIGPNGSGKSNLIDVIRLARSLPTDMQEPVRGGGGVVGWRWSGLPLDVDPSLELAPQAFASDEYLSHRIDFIAMPSAPMLWTRAERIAYSDEVLYMSDIPTNRVYIRLTDGNASDAPYDKQHRQDQSALSQFLSPREYPVITWLNSTYGQFRIHNKWQFGREAPFRQAQPADMRGNVLEDDCSNLGLFLNQTIDLAPAFRRKVVKGMSDLHPRFTDYHVVVNAGAVHIFGMEGDTLIPAIWLSDGTLRYLCLLAILYNPNPPPLVCLEEPELGLHPDIVSGLAKHLLAASERMQLIVTTHSDILIDALSETPESIVVFENEDGSTRMKRLDADELSVWLEDYRLGRLWMSGQIGGTRW